MQANIYLGGRLIGEEYSIIGTLSTKNKEGTIINQQSIIKVGNEKYVIITIMGIQDLITGEITRRIDVARG